MKKKLGSGLWSKYFIDEIFSDNILFVLWVDIFYGTPILDIKPFLPSVDYVESEKNIRAEGFLGHHSENFINDSIVKIFIEGDYIYDDSIILGHTH